MSDQTVSQEVLNELARIAVDDEAKAASDAAKVLAARKEENRQRAAFRAAIRESRTRLGLAADASDDDILNILQHQPDCGVNLGTQTVSVDGSPCPLDYVLTSLWRRQRWSTEYRPQLAPQDKRYRGVTAKSDLKSTKDKTDFIQRYGARAFEELPLQAIPKTDLLKLTPAELVKLPTGEKTKIVARIGQDAWSRLLAGKGLPDAT